MKLKLSRFVTSDLSISLLYRLNRIYSGTFRLTIENENEWLDYLHKGGAVLLCTWHQQFFPAIRHFKNYNAFRPSIMISQSNDGKIVSGVAERTGWRPVRGSSSKGGKRALQIMASNLKDSRLAAHIIDGPKGPSGIVKNGVIRLAHLSDAVIVPFYVFAEYGWNFNSWDKFLLPKPFSKVSLRFGKMIKFEKVEDKESFERQRKQLQEIMSPALTV